MSNTKEEIILAFLKLNSEKGKASIQDIAEEVGIRKASVYSHFQDSTDLEIQALEYGFTTIDSKSFDVNFKAKDSLELLTNLIHSFAKVFATSPVCWYYSLLLQNRLFNPLYEAHFKRIDLMLNARIQVALEYCVQENWLDIVNTDYASMFLACAIKEKLPVCDSDWEFEEIPHRFSLLFKPHASVQ